MANLTITVDDEVLKRARMRALEQDTSVNAVLREYLEAYSGVRREQLEAVSKVISLSDEVSSRRGDRSWSRDELHERE
jgi:plasmid stability protein